MSSLRLKTYRLLLAHQGTADRHLEIDMQCDTPTESDIQVRTAVHRSNGKQQILAEWRE